MKTIMCCPTLSELPHVLPGKTGWPWTEESPKLSETMPGGRPWPKVSIVMPSLNQGQFIEETIRSILLQGYPNLELIIIDGGSTDGSIDIISKYSQWIAYWVSEPDRGQSHAVNKGIARATGQILHWVNSDDVLLPSAFSTVADVFLVKPGCRMVIGQAKVVDAQGQYVGEVKSDFASWTDFATRKCNIAQVATFFDRNLFEELGMIDESLEYSMDSELLLRFSRKYIPIVIESYLTAYRMHGKTKFDHNRLMGFKEADKIYLRYLLGTGYEPAYRRWSSNHWLSLSSFDNLSYKERVKSILEAARMRPSLICTFPLYLAILRASRLALKELAPSSTCPADKSPSLIDNS